MKEWQLHTESRLQWAPINRLLNTNTMAYLGFIQGSIEAEVLGTPVGCRGKAPVEGAEG